MMATQDTSAVIRSLLQEYHDKAQRPTMIVSSFQAVEDMRRLWSGEKFFFGVQVTTLPAWVSDIWGRYGDGRNILSTLQRNLLLHKVLAAQRAQGTLHELALTPGTVKILTSMAHEALPFLLDDERISVYRDSLTSAECEVCQVLKSYAKEIDRHGFCEYAQALEELTIRSWPVPPLIGVDCNELTHSEKQFLKEMNARTSVTLHTEETRGVSEHNKERSEELSALRACIFNPNPDNPVKPTGALRFLLPEGRYALPLLLGQSVVESVQKGNRSIAISSRNPETLFSELVSYGVSRGVSMTLLSRKTVGETDFGRLWSTLFSVMSDETFSSYKMTDIALSAFSDISQARAYELDALWRKDRRVERCRCIADLCEVSPLYQGVWEALEKNDYQQAFAAFEARILARFRGDEGYYAEQCAALNALREGMGEAVRCDVNPREVLDLLFASSITFNVRVKVENSSFGAVVDIMSLEDIAERSACSYEELCITDLDALSYPIRDTQDAKTLLFRKVGIEVADEGALERARRVFFRALSVPKYSLIGSRVLNTVDAQPAYPAIMLEELLDCYRNDLVLREDTDKKTGLPHILAGYVKSAGEDQLFQNLVPADRAQTEESSEVLPPYGKVGEEKRIKIILPHTLQQEAKKEVPRLSPSAIESYLECPYKWFSLRRLRLQGFDAGFGPIEKGTFAHGLLRHFYLAFQEQISDKVTPENLPEAKELLATLFDRDLALQSSLDPQRAPLIPCSSLEEAELGAFKKVLLSYLDYEAVLLPGFVPRYFEQDFGGDTLVPYAGCALRGSIDRIDVNRKGQAVVIDYKGSLTPDYAFSSCSEIPWVPGEEVSGSLIVPYKVQTLLYAQVVRRVLGLDVVAALYVSYDRGGKVQGAYDPYVVGPCDIPGINPEKCSVSHEEWGSFHQMLDDVEAGIMKVETCMAQGFIAPSPRGKDPCGFCPVTACPQRHQS